MLDQTDVYNPIIAKVFAIQSYSTGTQRDHYIVKFTGKLYSDDSAAAYEELHSALTSYQLTPLFRVESGEQVIYLVKKAPKLKIGSPVVNLVLFILTLISVIISGVIFTYKGPVDTGFIPLALDMIRHLPDGIPFAISLLAILSAHEFGHYFAGRYHKTLVTLPYFIPFPFSAFGTMGAFIQMKQIPRNRNHLLDIGLAGPVAGFIVAVPVLLIGLALSKVGPIPTSFPAGQGFQIEGNSIIYLIIEVHHLRQVAS